MPTCEGRGETGAAGHGAATDAVGFLLGPEKHRYSR